MLSAMCAWCVSIEVWAFLILLSAASQSYLQCTLNDSLQHCSRSPHRAAPPWSTLTRKQHQRFTPRNNRISLSKRQVSPRIKPPLSSCFPLCSAPWLQDITDEFEYVFLLAGPRLSFSTTFSMTIFLARKNMLFLRKSGSFPWFSHCSHVTPFWDRLAKKTRFCL